MYHICVAPHYIYIFKFVSFAQRSTQGGGTVGLQPPQHPQSRNLENTDFVDRMISKVLRYFPFNRKQSLKTTDDWYSRILTNKLIKLKKTRR
jgi:hypothetical protein